MQKFTEKEQADFKEKRAQAERETREKHAPEIARRTQELEAAIAQAKKDRDAERRKALQAELKQFLHDAEEIIKS